MRLTVVGCSGSVPGPDSPASCYLLSARDGGRTWRVVLDLGSGAFGPLQRYADPVGVDAVVLSHLHADHCLDATALYVAVRYGPTARRQDVPRMPVWGPPGTGERLARAHDLPADPGMSGELDVRDLVGGEAFEVGPLRILPLAVLHPVPAFGLRITGPAESGGRAVVAYTGDTDDCDALDDLAAGADLLLSEASFVEGPDDVRGLHLTGARAGAVAERAGAQRLVLTHVPPWTSPLAVLAEASRTFTGRLDLAHPGDVLIV